MNSNTPTLMQSEEERAPWNNEPKTVNVVVSETLSRVVTVEVNEIYDKYDLREAVREQIECPSDRCSDWDVDDFEVVEDA